VTCCFNMPRLRVSTAKLGVPVLTVHRDIDCEGRAYNFAVLLYRYNCPLIRKGSVCMPQLATILPNLAERVRAAVISVTPDLLTKVWIELNIQIYDSCWAQKAA
jgi:hypothetical protein